MIEYNWIKHIRKGDVLRSPSGKLRIVRQVNHNGPSISKTYVTFLIQHCSWTGRCYTVYTGNDLRQMEYMPVRARMKLNTKFDKLIEREFWRIYARDAVIDCCDVRGLT
jgi:hypothetical protein